jgi:hypothetical protein
MSYEKEALRYHKGPQPGKIEVVLSKPCLSQSDRRLAYTPGAAVMPSIFLSSSPCTISFCETRWPSHLKHSGERRGFPLPSALRGNSCSSPQR